MKKRFVILALALMAIVSLRWSTPTSAQPLGPGYVSEMSLAASVTLNPVADAYVDQTYPSTNYGTAAELRADRTPVQYGLLRFNVSGLSGSVSQAILRVYTNNALAAGFNLYRVANNTWGETTLTSSNAPTPGALIGSATNCAVSAWASVDVTAYVTGNGTFSFALINLTNDALSVSSREGPNAPQLIVTTNAAATATPTRTATTAATATRTATTAATATRTATTAATATRTATTAATTTRTPTIVPAATATRTPTIVPAATATRTATTAATATRTATAAATSPANAVTLSPVADAYVDQTYPATNYGSVAELRADRSPVQYGMLRYDVSGLSGSISQAILRVHTNNALAAGFNLYRVANNTWGETTLTSSNAPAPGTLIGSATNCAVSAWASVDVTAYVTGNGTFSFALVNLTNDALSMSSREGPNAPQLVITTNATVPATATPPRTATGTVPTATRTATTAPTAAPTTGPTAVPPVASHEWSQEAHDAQRTGYVPVEPAEPWSLLWTWNGPDASGGTGSHTYNAPREARTVAGAGMIFVPAGAKGLYALAQSNGQPAWNLTATTFNATPAYDPACGALFAGGADGKLYKINAATGAVLGTYAAGAALNHAILITGGYAFAVTDTGVLHKISTATLAKAWSYAAASTTSTGLAYSASRDLLVFATDDLNVQGVNNSNGSLKWRVKPSPNTAGFPNEFRWFWPVVADQHGVVFLRMRLDHNAGLWGYPSTSNIWPNSLADARAFLQSHPEQQNLFALNLDDGTAKFTAPVGYGGTEDLVNGSAYLTTGPLPVVKALSGSEEVAYSFFRNGQSAPPDGRWDSTVGEMVLDNSTISGLVAGDLRFIKMSRYNGYGGNSYVYVTDEQNPLTMAGNTLFHAHWGASESVQITDRSAGKGLTYANPISTSNRPVVIRRQATCSNQNVTTHYTTCGLTLFNDGRFWSGPGFWTYWNVLDPPTPNMGSYSDGARPRYTYVTGSLIVVQGNGGELMVVRHSGTP